MGFQNAVVLAQSSSTQQGPWLGRPPPLSIHPSPLLSALCPLLASSPSSSSSFTFQFPLPPAPSRLSPQKHFQSKTRWEAAAGTPSDESPPRPGSVGCRIAWERQREEGTSGLERGSEAGPRQKLRLHLCPQVCSQPHLWCAQLQGPAGQVGWAQPGEGSPALVEPVNPSVSPPYSTGASRGQGPCFFSALCPWLQSRSRDTPSASYPVSLYGWALILGHAGTGDASPPASR